VKGVGSSKKCALVEYIGKFPGLSTHGNSATPNNYVRTDDNVMEDIGELSKTNNPMSVYSQLNKKYELAAPKRTKQMKDKRRNDRKKEGVGSTSTFYRGNVDDHILQIKNLVHERHPFIRHTVHNGGKGPSMILYTDQQMEDLKILCCTGQAVLGLDKTFNLCDMHVTASCLKHVRVERTGTGDHPLFLGPIFIHYSSDFETYSAFFSHLIGWV
jgi:hypothetical protein